MGTDELDQIKQSMTQLHIMRIDEMPRIELYLDQVLAIVSDELAFMAAPGETLLTGSMVNNYVKQHVIPAPQKKRYTRRHIAYLLFVTAMKRVFSIAQIQAILEGIEVAEADKTEVYDCICTALEQALAARFGGEAADPPELGDVLNAAVDSLAAKVYVEKCLEVR